MAEGTDVSEMFQKMGEKLGWFKQNSLDEAKQGLTLSAKKTKMNKENPETGKKTDKLKLKKRKTKVAGNSSKQSGKSETVVKQNLAQTKAQSFQILLSSDSDSSIKDIPEDKSRKTSAKAVLQLCSDSDDDDFAPAVNTKGNTDACVKESFVDAVDKYLTDSMTFQKFEPIVNIGPKRKSDIYCDDTVVKNRVSLASCTLDLENLGEPLVESTRIHRRSSITYKQIIEDLDSSMEDCKVAEDIKKFRKEHQKQADEMLDLETSVCNETNYITAIETVDDTLNSPESNICNEKSNDRAAFKEQTEEMQEITHKVRKEKKTDGHICKINDRVESDNSVSGEEVEVMDTATQTDEVDTADNGSLRHNNESDKKMHRAYKEETILDTQGKVLDFDNRYKATGDIYNEDTVQDSHVNVDSHSLHQVMGSLKLSNSEREQSSMLVYAEATVNEDKHASTTIGSRVHDYSKETVGNESNSVSKTDVYNDITGSDDNSDVYEQETNRDSGRSHAKKDFSIDGEEVPEASDKMYDEHEEIDDSKSDSIEGGTGSEPEESIVEVNDAGTQTEEVDQAERINASADEEQKTSDQSNIEALNSEDELKENEQNECSYSDVQENVNRKEAEFISKNKFVEDISDESYTSARSGKDISASTSDSSDSSDAVSASFARLTEKSGGKKQKERQKKVDVTEQSWRSSRRYSSDSSSDGNLEAFFQKLKKPEPKKSDSSSPLSMDDFIVEDDDMTSESDDSGFHLRETQELENRKEQSPKLRIAALDDDDDSDDESDDFSSKIYPPSVTKHKKKKQAKAKMPSSISWSFSSDSEEEPEAKNRKPLKKQMEDNKSKDLKSAKSFKNTKIDLSSDSDTELFNVENFKTDTLSDRKRRIVGNDNGTTNTTKSLNSNERNSTSENGKMGRADGLSGSMNDEEPLFKTPNPLRKKKNIFEENKENVFRTPTSTKGREPKTPKSISKPVYISLSDTDSDADDSSDFVISISDSSANNRTSETLSTPLTLKNVTTPRKTPLSLKNGTTPMSAKSYPTCTFLKSLSNTTEDSRRHPEARRYVNNFKKYKEELSSYLFKLYNQTIFENKLPSDMPVIWNKRLLRTAGYCAYKKNSKDDRDRSTRIELSVKVCDNAERVRDTLIHEMCHAAVWLLNGVNGGHGSYWKYWARHATRSHPELPAVSVCHSYSINTKFTYRCKKCGYSVGRHSKSLDVKKKVCGYCRGEFELIQNSVPTTPTSAKSSASSTPRQPSKFALFVKDNYNSVKRQNKDLKHGDVMKELSKLFAESKITS